MSKRQPLLVLGGGRSPAYERLSQTFDVYTPANDEAVMEFAERQIGRPFDLLGQGAGARLAAETAALHRESVQQLILVSPAGVGGDRLEDISCLTLIVEGSHDPSDAGRELRKRIPSSYLA